MHETTKLAIKKLIAQPELKDNPEFWLDYAVHVIKSVDRYEQTIEFFDVIPSMLVSRAETNFNSDVGEGDYPVILEVVERGKD